MVSLLTLLLASARAFDLPPQPVYSPEQLARLPEITELDLSPDGCLAAFAADLSGAQELWALSACGAGTARQLSRLGEQVTEVHFSPDGKKVLFASDRGGDERRDLFLADAEGGDPVNLTKSPLAETNPDGVQSGASFSPDGTRIAYTADPDRPFQFQLMVMDLKTRAVRRLTREPQSVHFPTWSPDGKTLAVTRSGDDHRGELLLVDAATGAKREVKAPLAGGVLRPQGYSPDGRHLLCLATNDRGFMQLALVTSEGRFERYLGPGDWDVERARWHPKAGIVYVRNEDGRSALYRMAAPPAAVGDRREDREEKGELLYGPEGTIESLALDAEGRRLAFLWGDSRTPAGIYALDLSSVAARPERLSPPPEVDVSKLSKGRMIAYRSFGGVEVHALFIPPASRVLGEPPPLIVSAHGGPDLQVTDDFNPKLQALSQAGFAVLAPNYRGSTGYGRKFLDLNNMDWGGGDLKDLVEGVRHMAVQGQADPERVGITGGSYGGYLTLMALAKTPGIWAAGVEAYGMPDLVFDYEATGERFRPWYKTEMGEPKKNPALYRERSPIHFVGNIGAPLLIFQGENDTNVPKAESELVYRKLQEIGSPAEYVLYPDEGHGFTKLKNRLDCYRRMVDFFVKHLSRKAR